MKHRAAAPQLALTRDSVILPAAFAVLLAAAAAQGAHAQAVTNPNQIVGIVHLATTTPEILDAMRDAPGLGEGLVPTDWRRRLTATSIGSAPELSHSTRPQVVLPGRDRATYDLTVESSATGIPRFKGSPPT